MQQVYFKAGMKLPNIDQVIEQFKLQEPGFIDFEHSQSDQIIWIRDIHTKGLVKAKQILDELKENGLEKDEFISLLGKFLNSVTYYFDWREVMRWRDISGNEGFQEECTDFLRALPIQDNETFEHYSSYFSDQLAGGFAAVNYFILFCHFIYDPKAYSVMKITRMGKAFKLLGIERKLSGHLIGFDQFTEINSICRQLFYDLKALYPKDMSDVQIFMHFVAEY